MNIGEAVRIALASLWANKLRSTLTLLGVVIGVAAVIAVVTFVSGINGYVAEKIFNLGADVIILSKSSPAITNVEQWLENQRRKPVKMEDYEYVKENCEQCKVVGASGFGGFGAEIRYGNESSRDTNVRGWTPSMARIYDLEIVAGRGVSESDFQNNAQVAVIGNDIYEKLFKSQDPLNRDLRIGGRVYRVIGLGKKEGKALGQSRDNYVIIPLTTWDKQFGNAKTSLRVWAKAYGVGAEMDAAVDELRVLMRNRRHDMPGRPDTFSVDTNSSFMSIWANLSDTFFNVMIAMSAISLVVGGIVIMNIMLVSVTERTREIGIRKAMGARRSDVLWQFLIESGTMSLVGGVIGIIFGVTVAKTVTLLIGMPSEVHLWAVAAGLIVAASVGIFFGVYPAKRAAMLDPIVALRSEL